ncbi:hypothetical protein [Streptosporangium sp. NPDC000509]|uniref:hypothetical protein n=1 Tax=Streptosporangium sp. NPDC000509 TaxID=3366186 RepID=UPI0036C58473
MIGIKGAPQAHSWVFPDNPLIDPELVDTGTRLMKVILTVLRGYTAWSCRSAHQA